IHPRAPQHPFVRGLEALGYVDGKTVSLEYRDAAGSYARAITARSAWAKSRMPTFGIRFACCARAASGHAVAAAPPTKLMKSRRFMSAMAFSLCPRAASDHAGPRRTFSLPDLRP